MGTIARTIAFRSVFLPAMFLPADPNPDRGPDPEDDLAGGAASGVLLARDP